MNSDLRRAIEPAKRVGGLLLLAAAALWLASGLYSVKPEQRGVVRRFGQVVDDGVPPGIHYHWPWPVEGVERPAVTEIRSLSVSFGAQGTPQGAAGSKRDEVLLTGDENVVLGTVLLQYTIKAPRQYLFATASPEEMLTRIAQEATVARVAQRTVDDVLTSGRQSLQVDLKLDIQERVDAWDLGVRLTAVQIQSIEPPPEVAAAFKDVGAAREDKQKHMQEAEGDRNRRLPEARAEALRQRSQASAYAQERSSAARGEADRFLSAWAAYKDSKSVTSRRLYLEAMEQVLGQVSKIIVNPDAERNVRAVP
ncbi:MAG: FtsH protease activity modulator HflK [Deltaproteobacteria bacterium]|nr:FtsH protease activity modulator HflK [Deltaproteobacteria bacterium]